MRQTWSEVRNCAAVIAWLCACMTCGRPATAHEVYIGYGQAQVEEHEFTGQLAYDKLDLLQALERLQGDPLDTLSPAEFEALTWRYLDAHFQAVTAEDTLRLEIVERSQRGTNAIFGFRFRSSQPLAELRVRNDVLFELLPQQVNTLTLRVRQELSRHVFHSERPVVDLPVGRPPSP